MKLEIFFGNLDWEAAQNLLSLVKENFITFAKKTLGSEFTSKFTFVNRMKFL